VRTRARRRGPQAHVLGVRQLRTWVRNPVMLGSELAQYLFTAAFVALLYAR
jgi:hypothetical protein